MEIFSLRLITNEKEGFSLLFFFYSFFSFLLCGWSLNDDWTFQWNLLGGALFYFTSVLLLSIFSPTVVLWFDDNQKSLFFYIPLLLPFRDVTMEPNPFWSFIWIFTDFIFKRFCDIMNIILPYMSARFEDVCYTWHAPDCNALWEIIFTF